VATDPDQDTIDAARQLANVICSPHAEGPFGQNSLVDALAVRMLWEERAPLNVQDQEEFLRLWEIYQRSKF
jgi:hypothetical protein